MRIPVVIAFTLLAGCAGATRHGAWPTLAKRAGERDTGGPVCARCELAPPAPVAAPPAAPKPLPAGIDAELTAIEANIAAVEAKVPEAAAAVARARAAAAGKGESDDATIAAEVRQTQLEALLMPLSDAGERLDALLESAAGAESADARVARIAALQGRIAALRAGTQ